LGHFLHTGIAYTADVCLACRGEPIATDYAPLTNAARVSLQASRAGFARRILDWFTEGRDGRGRLTALGTWGKRGKVAGVADSIVAAVSTAMDTPVLCHVPIISQVAPLGEFKYVL
jgi:hypothetical protein